ncbi:prepilin-type N-terminal cleavage/methylation domain-containing protein [Shewanella sp. VB17]|uniref:prepilin-type N-terminal cleavage/methylation domain-containing protein n=1 Tax=Shewanella sp. VB17 TaxID=2739432 RepID=UPI001562F59E|nr:prepilin-type N-terminal cleavage/methylation domain-containing protein [Shewanella sp. VB17]NRD74689.1 prepilin-type N-terminal cleavage/methylation domain-containing protein [Shewanella sp. VB17]
MISRRIGYRGFTLIEVLIAMLVLSMVMFIGSLSFSTFSQRWQKDMGRFTQEVANAKNLILLQKSLNGMSNYIVKDSEDEPVYFFKGNEKYLMFVTNNPIFNTEGQALIRLSVSMSADGKERLNYEESPFEGAPLLRLTSLPKANYSQILLVDNNIRFNYYGWEKQKDRADFYEGEPVKLKWIQEYFSEKIGMLPYAVNISWGTNEPVIFPVANDNAYQLLYTHEKSTDA